jgi:hypothetical protein
MDPDPDPGGPKTYGSDGSGFRNNDSEDPNQDPYHQNLETGTLLVLLWQI